MEWFKKHADTIIILGAFASCYYILDEKIDNMNDKMNDKFTQINERIYEIGKDVSVIKTVMIMKNIIPQELAKSGDENGK